MNTIPRFTAEASLCRVSTRYQALYEPPVRGEFVEPAGPFSDEATLDTPFVSLGPIFTPRPLPCLRWQCIHVANQNPHCFRVLGFWNPATKRCE